MTVRIRNKETGAVVGVSEVVAEGLLVSDDFEVAEPDSSKAPAKKAAAKKSPK